MQLQKKGFSVLLLLTSALLCFSLNAQTEKQRELEAKKQRLEQEIRQINALLAEKRREKSNILEEVETLNRKINARQEIIKVTNQQTDILNYKIGTNLNSLTRLRKELEALKDDYASMVQKSYKSKSKESRLMFLLSSKDFFQAYKRMQYLKQYAAYRKQQGEEILVRQEELRAINNQLLEQRKEKEKLLAENLEAEKQLQAEKASQQALVNSIKKKEKEYAAQIRKKQQEADAIDRQIEKLIRDAIAKSNKASGKSEKASNFSLTAEAKLVDAGFKANKGKLPWPVEKGTLTMGFGEQPHPVVKSVKIKSNGVRIATEPGAKARAVFDGKVIAVQLIKGSNKAVLIQHGNYISVYNNLGKVYVKEGDNVKTKQEIGEIFTSKANNETVLKFSIYENSKLEDPAVWIYNM